MIPEAAQGSADPTALGAVHDGEGVNFVVFSDAAERMELCLFDANGREERLSLPRGDGGLWQAYLPGVAPGQRYGYRAYGRYDPENGFRFNPNKLLIDPYARDFDSDFILNQAHCGYDPDGRDGDPGFSRIDSAPWTPKGVVCDFRADPGRPAAPAIPWERAVLYEAHVRGQTILHPAVAPALRGGFDGFADDAVIGHIKSLGVTSVELMPVHAFVDEARLAALGLRNYWGYNSIGFFAPAKRYAGEGGPLSFRRMVRRLHDAGLEVILDVVYNHTAESDEFGPTISFRGLDNQAYYRLDAERPRRYVNYAGTGNILNVGHPRVRQMILDSLRYWAGTMEVDGFRFDLATVLGRDAGDFDAHGALMTAIGQDPSLNRLKLIAEPWDIGPGGYRLGAFPSGWAEWNDRFRDGVRSYWRGDHGAAREFAARFAGSRDIFSGERRIWASVNFVAAHDGMTLHDLVSFNAAHNEANGEDGADGRNDNRSFNHGVEGNTADEAIMALRGKQKRNLLASLFLGRGAPMLLAGDEFGRTQNGNNNAYCQDNDISWLDWRSIGEGGEKLIAFTRKLIALRAENAIFRPQDANAATVRWLNPGGGPQAEEHWNDPAALALCCLLAAEGKVEGAAEALILFNPFDGGVRFVLPRRDGGWTLLLYTEGDEGAESSFDEEAILAPRSLMALI